MAFFGSYNEIFAILLAISILREGLALDLQGKDVDQSTIGNYPPDGPPERAIDGNRNTACHTALGSQQWWSIDLGALYCLEKITIINRNVVHVATRLRGAKVRAGLSPTYSDNTEIGEVTPAQAATPGATLPFVVNPPVIARYVTVDLERRDYLHFAEIMTDEVMNPFNSQDRLRPVQQTKTVNVGDLVTIEMQDLTPSTSNYRWSINGVATTYWNDQLTATIDSVTVEDEGIYSCFIDGQGGQCELNSFTRLIVRACRAGMWGPPSCQNACRRCYNGGICDDKTGTCICPSGFSGDACQQLQNRDAFGSRSCSGTDCRGLLFCLRDPFGCSCAAGYSGLDCTQDCPDGMYGADCKQTCHCAGVTCLKDTGQCNGACEAQYSGGNCQCSAQNALLGLSVTADGPYQLTVTWPLDPCISGYTLQYALTNRGQCGEIPSPQRVDVTLSDVTMTTKSITVLVSHTTYIVYITPHYDTIQGPESTVSTTTLRRNSTTQDTDGTKSCVSDEARLNVEMEDNMEAEHCVDPTSAAPVVNTAVDATSITLSWQEVFCAVYKVEYRLLYWDNCQSFNPLPIYTQHCMCNDVMTVISSLLPNSQYQVRVQAHVDGSYGPLEMLTVFTNQAAPTGPPDEIKATSIQKRRLTLSWSEPLCGFRGGSITGYNYKLSTVASPVQVIIESTIALTTVTISDLMPYTEYKFEVSAITSVGAGPFGEAVVTRTLEAEPTVPQSVQVLNVDEESITLTWDEPNPPQGIITLYNVRYDNRQPTDSSTVVQDVTPLTHRIGNLQAHIDYFIQVQAATVVGVGPWSNHVSATTRIGVPGKVTHLRATSVTDRLISLEWEAPINPNGQITGYIIEYRIREKAYEENFEVDNVFMKTEVIMPRYQREAFEPGTKYEFKVSTRNQVITGLPSVVEVYTKPQNEGDIPQLALKVFSEETTDSTATIGLTEVDSKYIVSYIIKVERELSETKREAFIPKHHRDSANDYIAAEIPKADMSQRFVVGDSKMHGGYYNAPLQTGSTYRIRVGALSRGNASEATVKYSEPVEVTVQKPSGISVGLVVGVIVGLIVILVVAIVGYVLCRKRNARKPTTRNSESAAEGIVMSTKKLDNVQDVESPHCAVNPDDIVYEDLGSGLPAWAAKLEIKWEDLKIKDTVLGKGNFGEVRAGKVKVKGRVVRAAIKTLKAGAVTSAKDDFMAEFQTMTKIKKHLNVVCLLGACLHQDILHVALEFLPNGNLRDYLRKTRPSQETEQAPGHDALQSSPLTSSNLLTFGIDVARGMEHLSNIGIIHRDLAARNILLAEDLTAKVSDFGLSRGENIYVQKSSTRIPVRWLAIESLVNREYESKSDVWSFGILLWEIATFASTPYPGIDSKSLAQKLLDGYRMPKPENCADKMYDLMMRCWQEQRNDRPSFNELTAALERMNDPADESTYMAPRIYINCIIKPEFDEN